MLYQVYGGQRIVPLWEQVCNAYVYLLPASFPYEAGKLAVEAGGVVEERRMTCLGPLG